MAFWQIAMRPGKPMMHGRRGALSGARPARQSGVVLSCAATLFCSAADPPARRGAATLSPCAARRRSARDLPANDHRQDYLRAKLGHRP